MNDIFKQSEFATYENVIILNDKDEQTEKWVPNSVTTAEKKLLGDYRFKFKFCNRKQDINFTTYSSSFLLK